MKVALPARGEFGLVIRYHVPTFHALPGPKIAVIEPGMGCLYPSAEHHHVVDRVDDDQRRGMTAKGTDSGLVRQLHRDYPDAEFVGCRKGMPEARFVPEPVKRYGINTRVVICPRKRAYGSDKNWGRWGWLADALASRGIDVFAAGAPDSSDDVACPRAWEYPRFLDASVEAMLDADLVVATDAGLAHLAVLCGRPLLLITHEGKVAPGAVRDPEGRVMEPEYWPVRLEEYYHAANHANSPIMPVDGWTKPEAVVEEVERFLKGRAVA